MGQKLYLTLLIFCYTLSAEIGATQEDRIHNSTYLHIRHKRIIDNSRGGNRPVSISNISYIVLIIRNGKPCCAGSILSPDIILTAAHCVAKDRSYTIMSGSSRINNGIFHNITRKIVNQQYKVNKYANDLAMLKIFPPIDLERSPNRQIELHNGNLPLNPIGTFSGWGCIRHVRNSAVFPNELRSINVPIISQEACAEFYHGFAAITNKNICTHDSLKCSCFGDSGGPLVVNGQLVGVMSWLRQYFIYPDVFIKVSEYNHAIWISATKRILDGVF